MASLKCGENGHITEVASLKEGAWSCYRGCHFNGREKGHVRRGQFNGGRIVVMEASLKKGEW